MVKGSKAHLKRKTIGQRRTRKKVRTWNVLKKMRARRRTRKRWGLEGALKREIGLGNALPLMVKGSKAHLKRKTMVQRRTRKKVRTRNVIKKSEGSKAHSKEVRAQRHTQKRWGLEGALKREVELGNTLPWMVEGSKVHSKRKWGLEVALEREVGLGNALPWMVKGSKTH